MRIEESRIRRELQPLLSVVDNTMQWREEFEKRFRNTETEVLTLNKKMDFFMDTLLSKAQNGTVGNEFTNPQKETAGTTHTSRAQLEPLGKEI